MIKKLKKATDKDWQQWFVILDQWQAREHGHYATAKYLASVYKLNPWWSQTMTIRYEKERGYWQRSK